MSIEPPASIEDRSLSYNRFSISVFVPNFPLIILYNTAQVKSFKQSTSMYICRVRSCGLPFPNNALLNIHLIHSHGYDTCMYCSEAQTALHLPKHQQTRKCTEKKDALKNAVVMIGNVLAGMKWWAE